MVAGRFMEEPQYGGTIHLSTSSDPRGWDSMFAKMNSLMTLTYEPAIIAIWENGPSGTNEYPLKFVSPDGTSLKLYSESINATWEYAEGDMDTQIWHIKPGMYFQPKPPVNGREVTADDWVYAFERGFTIKGFDYDELLTWGLEELAEMTDVEIDEVLAILEETLAKAQDEGLNKPWPDPDILLTEGTRLAADPWKEGKDKTLKRKSGIYQDDVVKLDRYTISVTFYTTWGAGREGMGYFNNVHLYPREVTELEFNATGEPIGARDWRNAVGSGPWMLEDYVAGSTVRYERHPNWHMMDPFFPENRMPYPDELIVYILPDTATLLAAIATGEVDQRKGIGRVNKATLLNTAPQLIYAPQGSRSLMMHFRCDRPPFDNVNVRRALSMAVDRYWLIDEYFMGDAVPLDRPVAHWADAYTPIDELPELTQKYLSYHPEEAKAMLLAEGYPEGTLKFTLDCTGGYSEQASLMKSLFEEIGVTMEINFMEPAAFWTLMEHGNLLNDAGMSHGDAEFASGPASWYKTGEGNYGRFYDPWVDSEYYRIPRLKTAEERAAAYKEFFVYILGLAPRIYWPGELAWVVYQPWVKRYSGEVGMLNNNSFSQFSYVWIDQALKAEFTGEDLPPNRPTP